ncbi:MAG: hypothetical protein Q3972_06230, partial [Corynebacterium sp.]|nr:hypothetical protein [Corynebacterium sp.]
MNAFSSTSRDALQDALSVIVARTSVLGTRIRAALEADQADDMQHLGKRVHFATRYFIALGEFGFDFPLPSEPLAACDSIEEETRMWDIAAQVLRERTVDWLQEDGVPGILALRLKLDWDFLLPAGWDSSQFDAIIRAKDGYSLASELTTMPQAPDTHSVKDAFNEILQNSGMATTEQDDPKDHADQDA